MALKKLPSYLQSKFRASFKTRSFKTAVEELVYNALDAKASFIAVRVDLKQDYIQVVDNGHGVAKGDFRVLGEQYTTSKFEESMVYKSVQMSYGCFGQSLANLIEVSQSVKITSKCMNNEETWMKHFCNGKEEACSITTDRPSVGTTVEIKGFLYNLTIQKKSVKALQELQKIKTFLEQMALIHCNTSISLRDNSLNEIIFQVHKNRDVLKTLSLVQNICTSSLQEFQVEKNEYKVTGFIQSNNEETKGYQWIYVNGRFIGNSNLHKTINNNLARTTPIRKSMKFKSYKNEDEKTMTKNTLPDYFIFIKCPKNDYEVVSNHKQAILEFKNVIQIDKLLDKLVKFYTNEKATKEKATNKEPDVKLEYSKEHESSTRNKIKQIMQKIIGSQRRKMSGSNVHNGVKGKIMRRKVKKKCGPLEKAKLKIQEDNGIQEQKSYANDHAIIKQHSSNDQAITPCLILTDKHNTNKNDGNPNSNHQSNHCNNEKRHHVTNNISKNKLNHGKKESSFLVPTSKPISKAKNKIANVHQQRKRNKEEHSCITQNIPYKTNKNNDIKGETILSRFEKVTEVHKRCNRLAKEVDHLLKNKKRRYKIFTHETIQYSNIMKNNKSISVRQKINEIIIHEYVPLVQKNMPTKKNDTVLTNIKKSNDLLCPVMEVINHNDFKGNVERAKMLQPQANTNCFSFTESCIPNIPGPSYDSHSYLKDTQIMRLQNKFVEICKKNTFISKTSLDNLASPIAEEEVANNKKITKHIDNEKVNNLEHTDVTKTSYSIHFTKTGSQSSQKDHAVVNTSQLPIIQDNDELCSARTYTIAHSIKPEDANLTLSSRTCAINAGGNHLTNKIPALNSHLCSEQSSNIQNIRNNTAATNKTLDNNIVFISNSQIAVTGTNGNEPIEQIRISETIKDIDNCDKKIQNNKLEGTFILVSTNNVVKGNTEPIEPIEMCEAVMDSFESQIPVKIVDSSFRSYWSSSNNLSDGTTEMNAVAGELYEFESESRHNVIHKNTILKNTMAFELDSVEFEPDTFNLINRRRYIPKGMSPIFQLCNFKNVPNFEKDADYFEATVYNNFAQNVQIHSEIYKPKIQNLKESASRDAQRADIKMNKDNACLTFNSGSLQNAKVLGQVDRKFIAAILNGSSNNAYNCLILFDQHAVHERIRLEQNMSDYINQDQWKTVSVDCISLKLSNDDIIYLHNYREKFERLGLRWSIASDTQVLVNAIPAAILGKHLRQVDVVLKAVNSLIREEISIIKEQGGCVSLLPKSIMDLVFSEACRYAIMFGTALTVPECSNLIEALSRCRTPFQCAHGRPALAVLVDVADESRPYTVNFTKVAQFRKTRRN